MNCLRTLHSFLSLTLFERFLEKLVQVRVGTAMHLSQAGVRFSSTLWHHFISAPSYLLRQAWQSVRSSTIIVSLLNQSNSYYVLSVAFRSENDDGQQHLEADNYLTLELAEEGRTFSRNIYLNFNVIFFFFSFPHWFILLVNAWTVDPDWHGNLTGWLMCVLRSLLSKGHFVGF